MFCHVFVIFDVVRSYKLVPRDSSRERGVEKEGERAEKMSSDR